MSKLTSLLIRAWEWIMRTHPTLQPIPVQSLSEPLAIATPPVEVVSVDSATIVAAKVKRSPSRSKTQIKPDTETFSALLEGLDDSYDSMQIPSLKGGWLPKSDIRALHKLGIFIPTPWEMEYMREPTWSAEDALPSIASCLLIPSKHDTADKVHPRFAFAIKEPRLPENVEQFQGVAYRFGYCVQLSEKENEPQGPARLFWVWAWVCVGADGTLRVPKERRAVVHHIHHRTAKYEGRQGGNRTSSFVSHEWQAPTAFTHSTIPQDENEAFLLSVFRQLLLWWNKRPEGWSVGVRKNGKRVTFNIDRKHTAAYFADREKVVAVDGTSKKIIHFVREHVRSNGSTVKPHVRGLREFNWRGFDCHVTAPALNGIVATTYAGVPVDVNKTSESTIDTYNAAVLLADIEDFSDLKDLRHAA